MYFLNYKRTVTILLILMHHFIVAGQEVKVVTDSLAVVRDSVEQNKGSVILTKVSKDAIDATVTYNSKGSKKNDMVSRRVYLIDEAEVSYKNINLKADSIVLDMDLATVFASGRIDSTGRLTGKVIFKEGEESYEVDSLRYSFKSTRAIINNIVTRQQEGFLHSSLTKKQDDGTLHFSSSSFTTCDAEHPHFKIEMPRAKIYPDEKIVSGPAYLVIEDIPLPLIVPFFYFPVQKKLASGIIMPKFRQQQNLGYSLADGGYYFAGNDYFDLTTTGSIYTNGTWLGTAATRYNLRYRFSGGMSFSFANNVSGHKGLPDFSKARNYRLTWNHTQDPKANPGSRLSASVSMSSSSFDRANTYEPLDNVTTQRQSSVSYQKTWAGTPFNFSTSMNHSQNNANNTVSLNLPKAAFTMSRIYPLKGKRHTGPTKWYQDLQLSYSAQFDNHINTYDSLLFTSQVWQNAKMGFKHTIPVSLQLRPFNNFSISPSLNYTGVLYPYQIQKIWVPDYFDPELNKVVPRLLIDTIGGLAYGQAINPAISAGFSPQIFGFYEFRNSATRRLQQVRHVMKPSVGFSYIPYIKGLSTEMYRDVQADTLGNVRSYSIFENSLYGTPSLSQRSGGISLSLVNILEAKVFEKDDTTGKAKKVRLIENLGVSTSYNVFADSIKWSRVNLSFRTMLFEQVGISASAAFDPYALNERGARTAQFVFQTDNKLLRLENVSASLDFDLRRLLGAGEGSSGTGRGQSAGRAGGRAGGDGESGALPGRDQSPTGEALLSTPTGLELDEFGYAVIDMPWTMTVAYNFNLAKSFNTTEKLIETTIRQQFTLNGTLKIAAKTDINYTTGYDISQREITMTRIGIRRDLHCWHMSFNWIPTGYLKSWDFTIRINSAMLSDLKYERRKDYRENF